jgi:hypothetical protein
MRTRTKNILLLFFMAILAGSAGAYVYAAQYYNITVGGWAQINEWGTCKRVTNDGLGTIFIPTNSDAEWTAARAVMGTNMAGGGNGFLGQYSCSACQPMKRGYNLTGTCNLLGVSLTDLTDETCSAYCTSLGATACQGLWGSTEAQCQAYNGDCYTYLGNPLWNAAVCSY